MKETISKIKCLPKDISITILPHDNIDVDSIFSAILLSKLLTFYKIKNQICIYDLNIASETKYIIDKLEYDYNDFISTVEDENRHLFLVDHYETKHKGKVIGCIDHHFTLNFPSYNIYLYKSTNSTAYIIYNIMKEINFEITSEIILLVSYATLSDTCSFTNTKTNIKEKEEILKLLRKNNFNIEKMLEECLSIQDLNKMTIGEIIYNGVKSYNFYGHNIKSSYIQIDTLEISCKIIDKISNIVKVENLDMWVFIVYDMINKKSKIYKIKQNKIESEEKNVIVSRGQDVMPEIEKQYGK